MKLDVSNELIQSKSPIPQNEMERLLSLSDLDLDFSDQHAHFKDLAKLAAKVAGTSISLVNMIDSLTQWTISNYGLDIDQMMRQDTVCQYTIMTDDHFEVNDLTLDERFKDKFYVAGEPKVNYYYGIPLKISEGLNIGVLCMLDQQKRQLDPEKIELLKIIADEIVSRLKTQKVMEALKARLLDAHHTQQKVAHDIRGPLGGIIGLASIIRDQGESNQMEEVLEFINLIHKSGNSILDLAEEILGGHKPGKTAAGGAVAASIFNLLVFKDKLEKLYRPQAVNKGIQFQVKTTADTESIPFSKNKLLQIAGNLISNAMKFTPEGGTVTVDLRLILNGADKTLIITVTDSGIGLNEKGVQAILEGSSSTTDGTEGEQGYGFGLALVKHLVESLRGKLTITSDPGNGASFSIILPLN
jgi:signal transduction histidine kinase